MTFIEYAQIAAPIIFVIAGVAFFGWFNIVKETNKLLREQNDELRKTNEELTKDKIQIVKEMAAMQGQIDVLKSIPLVNIDTTLKEIASFNKSLAQSNKEILNQLKNTAKIAAEDRDVLTNQNKHIAIEVGKEMKKRKNR